MIQLNSKSIISYNPEYMTVDGQPWFPVMGEIHYSRVPEEDWEYELLKMKAGGVDVVSAYCIWIHHEEIEGEWNFAGNHDLRRFLETIKRCGLYCVLRIGPWAHGEVRNGGFPDWLVNKEKSGEMQLRSNDPGYLAYVKLFYEKLWRQSKGMLIADDGPVIGIQIENEYGHCGGLQGEEGEQHMRTLLAMAKETGFITPVYTATGWGGAVTGGMLPVMGGYCEAPWDQRLTEIEPSGNYVFTAERNDHNIGSDYGFGAGITFDMSKFPYLTAELGGGLQVTHHRRPIASASDIAAMTMVKLGSGCNLLGYYMYHGGTNPDGKLTTLQESRATGYPNDLPVRSYDFNAPIKEYGQLTDTFREIRRITMFTKDYQDLLCQSRYTAQPGNPDKPEDLHSVRTAARIYKDKDGVKKGFYFLNNYQRRYKMDAHKDYVPTVYDEEGNSITSFSAINIEDGDYVCYPFNLPIGNATLKHANAIPLCIIHGGSSRGGDIHVFYTKSNIEPDYDIEGDLGIDDILTLSDDEAFHSSKIILNGKEYLIISEDDVYIDANGRLNLVVSVKEDYVPAFCSIPPLTTTSVHFNKIDASKSKLYAVYKYDSVLNNPIKINIHKSPADQDVMTADLRVSNVNPKSEAAMLYIDYVGDQGRLLFADTTHECAVSENNILADSFYTGQKWEVNIGRWTDADRESRFTLSIEALKKDAPIYIQEWPVMEQEEICRIKGITSASVYRIVF